MRSSSSARSRPVLRETRPRLPEGAALGHERREELLAHVGALEERDRDVITCRFFLELSEEETAEVLRVRRGTVKSRTSRALARLREAMGGD